MVLLAIAGISIGIAVIIVAGAQRAAALRVDHACRPRQLQRWRGGTGHPGRPHRAPCRGAPVNTDSRLAPGSACGNAQPPTLDGVFDVRVETGRIGSGDPRAVCPAITPLNTPDALCVIKVSTAERVGVCRRRHRDSRRGHNRRSPSGRTADNNGFYDPRFHHDDNGGAAGHCRRTPPGVYRANRCRRREHNGRRANGRRANGRRANGRRQTGAEPLAQTGSADSLVWALLGVAMLDLGWLLCSAVRPLRGAPY